MDIMPTYLFQDLEDTKDMVKEYRKVFAAYNVQRDIVNTMVHLAKSYMSTDGS